MFLILFALLSALKPIRDTTIVVVAGDTIWLTPDRVWNKSGTIDIFNFPDTLGAYLDTNTVITSDSSWSSISTDIINSLDSGYTRFPNDVIFDSTLFVKKVNYAMAFGYTQSLAGVTTGTYSYTASVYISTIGINQYDLDSIQIDSMRVLHYASADSVAFYQLTLTIYEITSDGYNSISTSNDADSINYSTGETGVKTKTFSVSSNNIINAPLILYAWAGDWHNRSGATMTCKVYPFIIYLKAFYSK